MFLWIYTYIDDYKSNNRKRQELVIIPERDIKINTIASVLETISSKYFNDADLWKRKFEQNTKNQEKEIELER